MKKLRVRVQSSGSPRSSAAGVPVDPAEMNWLRDTCEILADAPAEYRHLHGLVSGVITHWEMGHADERLVYAALHAVLDLPDDVKAWLVEMHEYAQRLRDAVPVQRAE